MKKVLIAMSGGVDSAVSALFLKKQFAPIGIHFKFWPPNNKCCSLDSETKARKICNQLNIPFYVVDLQKEFKKEIVDSFLKSLSLGVTPNPCVWCNRKIKFQTLQKYSLLLKTDFIATGHYAKAKNNLLYQGKDKQKDQSYFLWQVNNFKNVIFPLGNLEKKKVWQIAQENNFNFAETEESQEICFVEDKLEDFLKKYFKEKRGDIYWQNKKIGEHPGLFYYTIGQRRGIELPGGPFYVLKKDVGKNILFVTKNKKDLEQKELFMKNIKWFQKPSLDCKAQIRYQGPLKKVSIKKNKVIFKEPQKAITPGQSIVFYEKDQVLGGGIII